MSCQSHFADTILRFLRELKDQCIDGKDGKPSNEDFWERVTELGPDISLIKTATVSETESVKVSKYSSWLCLVLKNSASSSAITTKFTSALKVAV